MIDNILNYKFKENDFVYYNTYHKLLEDLAIKELDISKVQEVIKNSDLLTVYKEVMSDFNTDILYKSILHGINHNIRVSIYALVISIYENIDTRTFKLITEACKYHDIGRLSDHKDNEHGKRSAEMIDFLKDKYSPEEINLLKVAITCHSLPDYEFIRVLEKNNIKDKEKCTKIFKILKDADALDRVRLSGSMIKVEMLRTDIAKQLIKFSYLVYQNYNKMMNKDNNHKTKTR